MFSAMVALISNDTPPQFYLTLATVVPWVDCAHLPSLALPLPPTRHTGRSFVNEVYPMAAHQHGRDDTDNAERPFD